MAKKEEDLHSLIFQQQKSAKYIFLPRDALPEGMTPSQEETVRRRTRELWDRWERSWPGEDPWYGPRPRPRPEDLVAPLPPGYRFQISDSGRISIEKIVVSISRARGGFLGQYAVGILREQPTGFMAFVTALQVWRPTPDLEGLTHRERVLATYYPQTLRAQIVAARHFAAEEGLPFSRILRKGMPNRPPDRAWIESAPRHNGGFWIKIYREWIERQTPYVDVQGTARNAREAWQMMETLSVQTGFPILERGG